MRLLLLAFCAVFLAAGSDDSPVASYRTRSSEVRVAFFATDQSNHAVETITQDDFAVIDGGLVVRNFRSLVRAEETTLDVVALVDTSESVSSRLQASEADVLRLASDRRLAEDSNFSIVSFSGLRPELLCSGNCRQASVGQRLREMKSAGVTPLYDALVFAADLASRRRTPGTRQALVLFSDGLDTVSRASAGEAAEAVNASGALLYAVDLNKNRRDCDASVLLRQLAESTGGRAFSSVGDAGSVLQSVLADLRASYVVTYQLPSHVPGFHTLRILPKHNLNLRFYCRSGYYYEKQIP